MQYYIPTDVAPLVQGLMPFQSQPFPRFFVIRPDHTAVPLIALDELPSWLQVGNWNWSDPSLFQSMEPANLNPIPRIGEYDVVCYHCCSNLDIIQRSVSQGSDNSGPRTDDRKSCITYPGAWPPRVQHRYQARPKSVISLPVSITGMPQGRSLSCTSEPKLCIVDSTQVLNPEAKVFDPTHATKIEVPRHNDPFLTVKSLPTTVSSSPTTAFSFESVSTRSHGQSSSSTSSMDAAITRLREFMGIGEKDTVSSSDSGADAPRVALAEVSDALTNTIHNENPQSHSSDEDKNHVSEEWVASGKRVPAVHGESDSKSKGKNNTSRGRRSRKRPLKKEDTHGEAGAETDNPKSSQPSLPVRKHARKLDTSQSKNNFAYGSRYWHMMTMPNWRDKTPQR